MADELVESRNGAAFAALVRRQHGTFTWHQALSLGISATTISRKVASGHWRRLFPCVYAVALVRDNNLQRLAASLLWAGPAAVLSHRSAASLLGVESISHHLPELTVAKGRLNPGALILHVKTLSPADIRMKHGLRLTTPQRTLLDLSSVMPPESLEKVLDEMFVSGMISLERLRGYVNNPANKGKRGIPLLKKLVDERLPSGALESLLEARLLSLIRRSGLPIPISQFPINLNGKSAARIDFAYPNHMLAIECDGYRYHAGRDAWRHDLERRNKLVLKGWRVIQVTWDDLTLRPEATIAQLSEILGGQSQFKFS